MTPSVLLQLKRVVDAIDPAKPTTAAIKAAEMIVNRAHGEPVSELERLNFDLARSDGHFTFNMSDIGLADTTDGETVEDAELGKPPALPPAEEPSGGRLV
jgi:hypothetical protein